MAEVYFWLGDVLPTWYDAGIAIFSIACKPKSQKMTFAINEYSKALIKQWQNSFGDNHVLDRTVVKSRLCKIVDHYYSKVYNRCNRKAPKVKTEVPKCNSIRALNKEWRSMSIPYNRKDVPINSLLDIGKNMDKLENGSRELIFYEDQMSSRQHRLSEEIDVIWVQQMLHQQRESEQNREELICEESCVQVDEESDDNILDVSINRSGISRVLTYDASTQTEECIIPPPKIRNTRDCTDTIKSACVQVSVNCGISTKMSTVAVQTVCKSLYGHEYYLSKEQAVNSDAALAKYKETVDNPEEQKSKRQKLECTKRQKLPRSKDDFVPYQNVLPSPRTLNDYKQLLAIQGEVDAANALYSIADGVMCTLHYDTTSRCKIDGEWPAIIFSLSDGQRYILRPLYFAYEDRNQIARLLGETYLRLAICVTRNNGQEAVAAKELWERTTTIMTDSVEKNLKIEDLIASSLGSTYKPHHTLCKSHTVEALDRSNINVLAELEQKLKYRDTLVSINPATKSFLRGEKSVVTAAIKSILNFVSHDKSAASTNQADLFDHIMEREKKVKHLSLYQERRFTKLGYSCASILDALPYIRMVLAETHLSNQHVEIVQMFVDSELLLTELNVLSYFTHKVSLPLLFAIEVCSQDNLCQLFPQLHKDLLEGSLETLSTYIVEYRHVKIQPPSSDIEREILKQMCIDAAKTIERQCGREYGFGGDQKHRATEIYKLPEEERKRMMVTNNIPAERLLAVFDKRAAAARCRNYKFKAKGIRNDLVLYQFSFQHTPDRVVKALSKILNLREAKWSEEQKNLHKLKIQEKMNKAVKSNQYTQRLLLQCKKWKGPVSSLEELNSLLLENPDIAEEVVKTELTYYRNTHRAEVIASPWLFKLNKVSHEERLTNLCLILNDFKNMHASDDLPGNKDALAVLKNDELVMVDEFEEGSVLEINQICITLWVEGNQRQWYIGYCIGIEENGDFIIEHLTRVNKNSNLMWKYPTTSDISSVEPEQIFNCVIDGDWDYISDRNRRFKLKNHEMVQKKFETIQ